LISFKQLNDLSDYTDVETGIGLVQKCNLQKSAELIKDIIVLGNKIAKFNHALAYSRQILA